MSLTYISAVLRREVIERAGNCCEYCRIAQADQFFTFEIDHIIAEKHGGATESSNLCLACPDCNAFKGSDVASVDWSNDAAVVALYHPRRETWVEHFHMETSTGQLEPLTAQARVTVLLLRLNAVDRVMDRKLLIDESRYPC